MCPTPDALNGDMVGIENTPPSQTVPHTQPLTNGHANAQQQQQQQRNPYAPRYSDFLSNVSNFKIIESTLRGLFFRTPSRGLQIGFPVGRTFLTYLRSLFTLLFFPFLCGNLSIHPRMFQNAINDEQRANNSPTHSSTPRPRSPSPKPSMPLESNTSSSPRPPPLNNRGWIARLFANWV